MWDLDVEIEIEDVKRRSQITLTQKYSQIVNLNWHPKVLCPYCENFNSSLFNWFCSSNLYLF